MRRTFKKGDTYTVDQPVEWQNGSHWLTGRVVGALDVDTLGYEFYPLVNRRATRTAGMNDPVRGYPGKVRALPATWPPPNVRALKR